MPSLRSTDGFTLPEVLIVIIVIGILAAIALPTFLGQVDRGHDATSKSDTASLASLIEQCGVEPEDFRACDTAAEISGSPGGGTGIPIGNGIGQVQIVQATATTYRLRGRSRSGTQFLVTRPASGAQQRTCAPPRQGGCPADGTW